MRELPHLVIDGAAVAARAVGAREAIIVVAQGHERTGDSLWLTLSQRRATRRRGDPPV